MGLALAQLVLRFLQRLGLGFAGGQGAVKVQHQRCRAGIVYFPQAGDDAACAGKDEGAGQADQIVPPGAAIKVAAQPGFAGREDEQVGVEAQSVNFIDRERAVFTRARVQQQA